MKTTVIGVQKDTLHHHQLQQEQSGQLARQAAEVADLASVKRQLADSQVTPCTSLFLLWWGILHLPYHYEISRFYCGRPWHDSCCSLASDMVQQSSSWFSTGSFSMAVAMSLIGHRQ